MFFISQNYQKLLFLILFSLLTTCNAANQISAQSKATLLEITNFFNAEQIGSRISKDNLPIPYNKLLTHPSMTESIENYYKRTAIIQKIYARKNDRKKTYQRVIVMLLDRNKSRNNAKFAQNKKETILVELAFIDIKMDELPTKIRKNILNTSIPFGKLLANNHIKILTKNRRYFSVRCTNVLNLLMNCQLNSKLYGRYNTIIRADNKKLLARVIEILPQCSD